MKQFLIFLIGLSTGMMAVFAYGQFGSIHASHDHAMHHEPYELSDEEVVPEVSLVLEKDPHGGYTFFFESSNFVFAPESVNEPHVTGEGHVHVFVNGTKYRVYSPYWWHVLEPGENEIRYTLNTNDHKEYVYKDKVLGETLTVIAD